ncbi:puromycin-sensitive aminopeptidase [Pelomyxa schiedti]|nr:puromycin-sensitive aminopeptidase [Pelomyxa schiedti]
MVFTVPAISCGSLCGAQSQLTRGFGGERSRVLLPKDAVPVHYDLRLSPSLDESVTTGEVDIQLLVMNSTRQITLHSVDTTISRAVVAGAGMELNAKIVMDKEKQMVLLKFDDLLPAGDAILHMSFISKLNRKMTGFYTSTYTINSESRTMAVTQFEPSDARQAFPCWDEPALKSTFSITLIVPVSLTALSNMPVESETVHPNGLKEIAFVVGELDYLEAATKSGIKVRVYTTPGKNHQGRFALDVAVRTLDYYNDYFRIPYPLPKCDMVAIPDFAPGAMENWGLVTYRETALLLQEGSSSVSSKQRVAYIVGHELAHQWFGNLVTMEWWSNLWLNEGFATYVGYQMVDILFPQWHIWITFTSTEFSTALKLDALTNTHAIEVEVYESHDVTEIFDPISYAKGASVIRMLSSYLGEAPFKAGLNIYLNKFLYSNAITEDLWDALTEASGIDIAKGMSAWTKTMGYPVVSIYANASTITFKQTRMMFCTSNKATDQQWWIPIILSSNNKHLPNKIELSATSLSFPHDGSDIWLKANYGQTGLYRVQYGENLLENLKLGVLSDYFSLAVSGLTPTSSALSLAMASINEVEYAVWANIVSSLAHFASVWSNQENLKTIHNFQRTLYTPIAEKLGWTPSPSDDDLTKRLRGLVRSALVEAQDPRTLALCLDSLSSFLVDPASMSPDLRLAVFSAVMIVNETDGFNILHALYKQDSTPEQQVIILFSMGCTRSSDVAEQLLNWGSRSGEVRHQDFPSLFHSVADHHPEIAWDWLTSNWEWVDETFQGTISLLQSIISSVVTLFKTEEQIKAADSFFKQTGTLKGSSLFLSQSYETVCVQSRWLARDHTDVKNWLQQFS